MDLCKILSTITDPGYFAKLLDMLSINPASNDLNAYIQAHLFSV